MEANKVGQKEESMDGRQWGGKERKRAANMNMKSLICLACELKRNT